MYRYLVALAVFAATVAIAATSFTTHYDLAKPADGDVGWGDSYRENMDIIDNQMFINQEATQDHIDNATGAHAATAISTVPGASTCQSEENVQDFLDCLDANFGVLVGGSVMTLNTDQEATGQKTFSAEIIALGGLLGDVTGNLTGGVTGNVTGNLTGNVTGNVSGTAATFTGSLTGDVTSTGMSTSIASGVIVNDDVNASAAIAGTKISPDFGSQAVQTTGALSADTVTATTRVVSPDIRASGSGGLLFEASSGTDVATFGAGGGSQAVFNGAVQSLTSFILQDPGAGTESVTLVAPTLAGSYTLTLPTGDGDSGQVLTTDGSGVLSWGVGGGSQITGSRGSPTAITAAGGIAAPTTASDQLYYIQGSGGAVNITANPQIAAGIRDGQELCLRGRSDTNTVQFDDGTGIDLRDVSSLLLGANDEVCFKWDTSEWIRTGGNL